MDSTEDEPEYIMSVVWKAGRLCTVFYDLISKELAVMQETNDFKPDYPMLYHLFHQIQPIHFIVSGPANFLEDIKKVLNINEITENKKKFATIQSNNQGRLTPVNLENFNTKNTNGFRQKIYELKIPGLQADATLSERQIFIDSVLPMENSLMVYCIGNLLNYFEQYNSRFPHCFSNFGKTLIITNVTVNFLESQVIIDEATLNALNVFSTIQHPASFKNQIRNDALSIYNLLNRCCSRIGSQQLKTMLKCPTRDLVELNLRLSTVEWCKKKENMEKVSKLKGYLKNIQNVSTIFHKIIMCHGKTNDWKSLKKTVYYGFLVCDLCSQFETFSIESTFIAELSEFINNQISLKGILYALDKIVDIEEIEEKNRFCVKPGLDSDLDKSLELLKNLINHETSVVDAGLRRIHAEESFHLVFFPEIGFVYGTDEKPEDLELSHLKDDNVELILQTIDAVYFRTPYCKDLNLQHETLMIDIITQEMRIFNRLIKYINENIMDVIEVTKLCAKLDCMISMAEVANIQKFVRPTFTTEKRIKIVNGRHPLVELIKKFAPNSTELDLEQNNLINILHSPNASGKSIYMKQIAIICFLAHIGCFVPADECVVSLLDSIYSRIYCQESIYEGHSSFMIDLSQMSKVIMNSSSNSLVLIDEIGKGTNYKDGMALLAATIEHFTNRKQLSPMTFIATHYSEVYSLLNTKELTKLLTIATEKNQFGIFRSLYKVTTGTITQNNSTEFPESNQIISNIFRETEKTQELEKFEFAYKSAVKVFVVILMKMYLKKGFVPAKMIKDMFNNVDLHHYFN